MQTAKVPERAVQKCVRSGFSSDSSTSPRHLCEVRTLHRKFNPDWNRDAAFPLWKISSSSCTIKVLVANTLLAFILPDPICHDQCVLKDITHQIQNFLWTIFSFIVFTRCFFCNFKKSLASISILPAEEQSGCRQTLSQTFTWILTI